MLDTFVWNPILKQQISLDISKLSTKLLKNNKGFWGWSYFAFTSLQAQ